MKNKGFQDLVSLILVYFLAFLHVLDTMSQIHFTDVKSNIDIN